MNKVKFLVAAILSVLFVACSEEENLSQTSKTGFQISLTESVKVDSRSTPAELGKPLISQFNLKITNQVTGRESYNGSYKDFISAAAGMYTIEAECGDNLELALDNPYYKGSVEDVTLENGESKSVKVICTVANALASVVFDNSGIDSFDEQFSSYEVKVKVGARSTTIGNNGKSAYYRAGSKPTFTFVGTLKNGTPIEEVPLEDAKLSESETFGAGQHCVITLKLREANSGAHVEISKVEVDKATINETIPMEWLPKPKVEAEGFDENNTLTFVETEQKQAALNLNLSSALQDMKFKFNFQDEQFVALDKEKTYQLSIAEDKAAIETALGITLPDVGDKLESIDLSNLLAKIQTNAGVTTTNTIEIDVKANNRWSSEDTEANRTYKIVCNKPEFSIDAYPGNIWTKEFTVNALREEQVTSGDFMTLSSKMTYQYSIDGETNWTALNDGMRQDQLTPGTAYYIRGLYRGEVAGEVAEVKTYPVIELENGNLNDYSIVRGKDGDRWNGHGAQYEWTNWTTLNELTTPNCPITSYSYNTRSGTRPVSDVRPKANDNTAVWIITIGYGYGGTNNSPNKVTPSELVYDKTWDNATRPTGIHFWYKYAPFNGDKSDISVEIYSGEQLVGNGTLQETQAISSYSEEGYTLVITYNPEYYLLNPNRVLITFKSGFNTDVESRESGGLVSSNTANPKFRGSELYIDDVSLVYDK